MATFTAYYDASGNHESPAAMFVSGFVATAEKWLAFEDEWRALLTANHLPYPFHMTDFKTAEKKEYRGWKNDLPRQHKFEREAIDVIGAHVARSFGEGIIVPDFDRMHSAYVIPAGHPWEKTINKPLAHCGVAAALAAQQWLARKAKRTGQTDAQWEIVFDHGDKHEADLHAAIRELYHMDVIPGTMEKHPPLQASDMLAWYHRRSLSDHVSGKRHWLGDPFRKLVEEIPGANKWAFSSWRGLQRYCKQKGFERKPTQ